MPPLTTSATDGQLPHRSRSGLHRIQPLATAQMATETTRKHDLLSAAVSCVSLHVAWDLQRRPELTLLRSPVATAGSCGRQRRGRGRHEAGPGAIDLFNFLRAATSGETCEHVMRMHRARGLSARPGHSVGHSVRSGFLWFCWVHEHDSCFTPPGCP